MTGLYDSNVRYGMESSKDKRIHLFKDGIYLILKGGEFISVDLIIIIKFIYI